MEPRSLQFLMQGIAVAVQRGNAAAVRVLLPQQTMVLFVCSRHCPISVVVIYYIKYIVHIYIYIIIPSFFFFERIINIINIIVITNSFMKAVKK